MTKSKSKSKTKVEAAMKGKECTCTPASAEGGPRIDPKCPFHGGDFGREQEQEQVEEQTST